MQPPTQCSSTRFIIYRHRNADTTDNTAYRYPGPERWPFQLQGFPAGYAGLRATHQAVTIFSSQELPDGEDENSDDDTTDDYRQDQIFSFLLLVHINIFVNLVW